VDVDEVLLVVEVVDVELDEVDEELEPELEVVPLDKLEPVDDVNLVEVVLLGEPLPGRPVIAKMTLPRTTIIAMVMAIPICFVLASSPGRLACSWTVLYIAVLRSGGGCRR
jgi:hypothetical protein